MNAPFDGRFNFGTHHSIVALVLGCTIRWSL